MGTRRGGVTPASLRLVGAAGLGALVYVLNPFADLYDEKTQSNEE